MTYRTENGSSSDRDDVDQSLALVLKAQGGDQQAFEYLYKRYIGQITAYLSHRRGNRDEGQELAQETFLKVWSALPGLRKQASFVDWLYRIAANCAHDNQRHTRDIQTVPLENCTGNEEGLNIEGPEKSVEQAELLQLALAQMTPLHRTCLILYAVEGLSQRQIAERLKIKESGVSKYVSRGREELRRIYSQLHHERSNIQEKRGKAR